MFRNHVLETTLTQSLVELPLCCNVLQCVAAFPMKLPTHQRIASIYTALSLSRSLSPPNLTLAHASESIHTSPPTARNLLSSSPCATPKGFLAHALSFTQSHRNRTSTSSSLKLTDLVMGFGCFPPGWIENIVCQVCGFSQRHCSFCAGSRQALPRDLAKRCQRWVSDVGRLNIEE